jgi:hypothetical protein
MSIKSNRIGAAFAVIFWSLVFGAMLVYRAVNLPAITCARGDLACIEEEQ